MAISACESPGVLTSTTLMSGRSTTARQSVAASSQPSSRAARSTFARVRPHSTFSRGRSRGLKNGDTWRYALLWARPMNAYPMSAMPTSLIGRSLLRRLHLRVVRPHELGELDDLRLAQLVLVGQHGRARNALGDGLRDGLYGRALLPLAIHQA